MVGMVCKKREIRCQQGEHALAQRTSAFVTFTPLWAATQNPSENSEKPSNVLRFCASV
jgi:hypothetical protein